MIVLPMMGLSSRFFEAGYNLHKYMLPLNGETVFHNVLLSFSEYFHEENFVFICRESEGERNFITTGLKKLRIKNYEIINLPHPTDGQADTISLGLRDARSIEELYIFNIDTFRHGFRKPTAENLGDGYLEVFIGDGDHWSFVQPGENNTVVLTTEKVRISNYCSNGLYYFKHKQLFDEAYRLAKESAIQTNNEYYIAPLYNHLIESGLVVKYGLVPLDAITFCGTPKEYEACLRKTDINTKSQPL